MKRVTVGGLLLLCAAVGAIWYFAGPASACSEQDEATAELLRVMKTPENLIASRRSGLRKGSKDIQSDPWKEEDRKLSAQQIADGAELASGIIYGDASRVQKVLERYDGRPSARRPAMWRTRSTRWVFRSRLTFTRTEGFFSLSAANGSRSTEISQ